MTTNEPVPSTQRKMEGLHALANLAEREGRPEAARALAEWADATAPFVPYTDAEILAMRPTATRIGGAR